MINQVLAAFRSGQFVIVTDDTSRENEGDLIIAATNLSTQQMAFMIRHTSGVVCVAMENDRRRCRNGEHSSGEYQVFRRTRWRAAISRRTLLPRFAKFSRDAGRESVFRRFCAQGGSMVCSLAQCAVDDDHGSRTRWWRCQQSDSATPPRQAEPVVISPDR